jgi:alpha-galactosidase
MERRVHLRGGPPDDAVSLLIDAAGPGVPRVLHFGPAIDEGPLAPAPEPVWGARLATPPPFSLLPTEGRGAFCAPALVMQPLGAAYLDLQLTDTMLMRDGVVFTVRDERAGVTVQISFGIDAGTGVVVTDSMLEVERGPLEVRWLAAACWPLPEWASDLLTLSGDWADEFRIERAPCPPGLFARTSRRGRSSHEAYPGLVIGAAGFGEDVGEVWGATLGWSGDHKLLTEPLDDGGRQLQFGERLGVGEVILQSGGRYRSPPAYSAFSSHGLNGLRAKLHGYARRRLLPASVAATPRPVTLNTWEAMYFGQSEALVIALAESAAALGVERFVLDDGWFVGRTGDSRALGDWMPDPVKHPRGLAPVAERVVALGMQFGLWVEPEMVSPDSDLHRAHPDWAFTDAGRSPLLARHQLVLDLTRPEVTHHLFGVLNGLLSTLPIGYLKWDMNRVLTDAAVRDGGGARPAHGAYVRALHALIDRVRAAHPAVEIEACASGGGRADWGMLARSERVWTSDNLDPLDRLRIQEGASLFLPPEVMGSHVGAARAHITGRTSGLNFRAHVATFGHFGVEASPEAMDAAEQAALAAHVAEHKRLRPLLHGGRQVRVETDVDHAALMTVEADRGWALLGLFRTGSARAGRPTTVRLRHLDPAAIYAIRLLEPVDRSVLRSFNAPERWLAGDVRQGGSALAAMGLSFQLARPQTSLLLELTRV